MKPAERMQIPRTHMPEQPADARRRNFLEVNSGLAAYRDQEKTVWDRLHEHLEHGCCSAAHHAETKPSDPA